MHRAVLLLLVLACSAEEARAPVPGAPGAREAGLHILKDRSAPFVNLYLADYLAYRTGAPVDG